MTHQANESQTIKNRKALPTNKKSFWIGLMIVQLFIVLFSFSCYDYKNAKPYCVVEASWANVDTFKVVMKNPYRSDITIISSVKPYQEALIIKKEVCEENLKSINSK